MTVPPEECGRQSRLTRAAVAASSPGTSVVRCIPWPSRAGSREANARCWEKQSPPRRTATTQFYESSRVGSTAAVGIARCGVSPCARRLNSASNPATRPVRARCGSRARPRAPGRHARARPLRRRASRSQREHLPGERCDALADRRHGPAATRSRTAADRCRGRLRPAHRMGAGVRRRRRCRRAPRRGGPGERASGRRQAVHLGSRRAGDDAGGLAAGGEHRPRRPGPYAPSRSGAALLRAAPWPPSAESFSAPGPSG